VSPTTAPATSPVLRWTLPKVKLDTGNPDVGGPDIVDGKASFTAYEQDDGTEPLVQPSTSRRTRPSVVLDIQVRGANKLRAMADQLRKADKEYLGRQLARAIKRAAEPTLKDLRESARNIHTSGVRKPGARHPFVAVMPPKGTRAKIADSITASVSVMSEKPARAVQDRPRPTGREPNMPRKFDQGRVPPPGDGQPRRMGVAALGSVVLRADPPQPEDVPG
jgi:hypothetical protein